MTHVLKSRPTPSAAGTAEIISFESEKARRLQTDAAAQHAADVLEDFYAGRAPFQDVLAALVAPFAAASDPASDPGLTLPA